MRPVVDCAVALGDSIKTAETAKARQKTAVIRPSWDGIERDGMEPLTFWSDSHTIVLEMLSRKNLLIVVGSGFAPKPIRFDTRQQVLF